MSQKISKKYLVIFEKLHLFHSGTFFSRTLYRQWPLMNDSHLSTLSSPETEINLSFPAVASVAVQWYVCMV